MKSTSSSAEKIIDRILELSADAQIARRSAAKDSPMFHTLTGAIAAYGNLLAFLTALQRLEEFDAIISLLDMPDPVAALAN
jgi:hypothetical protein